MYPAPAATPNNSRHVAVITKIDLASAVEFDKKTTKQNKQTKQPGMPVIGVSAKTGEGMDRYIGKLDRR